MNRYLALGAAALAGACNPPLEICDNTVDPSVHLSVFDPNGDALEPDSVRYRVDGGEWVDVACGSACAEVDLGEEDAGSFEVEASLCGVRSNDTVTVPATRCGVTTQAVELTLDPVNCATGSIEVSYDWAGFVAPVATCAEAGVGTLFVRLLRDGELLDTRQATCDDAPIVVDEVWIGGWTVEVADVADPATAPGPFVGSGPHEVSVAVGSATALDVVLTCDENGVDDGCGGA